MPRYAAFLRAINVGGHVVKMDRLKELFAELGYTNVTTFIASGNVLFETKSRSGKALEKQIETSLLIALGYKVATFVRTPAELKAVAELRPFRGWEADEAASRYIAFTAAPPSAEALKKIKAFASARDQFHLANREVYWLGDQKISESKFNGAQLEKWLAAPATMRNVTTVRKIAALM